MDDAAQAFLKSKIMDNIHKYYYLIVFAAYMLEEAELARDAVSDEIKAEVTLTSGKCAIPANKLKLVKTFTQYMEEHSNLRGLIDTGKGNLQWERDIPPEALANLEDLATKTLMRILPASMKSEVESLIETEKMTLDLYE